MSENELRRQSRYTWMLIAFTAIMFVLMAHQSRAQNFNWDGDNASGDFLNADNWYGNTIPSFSYSGNLVFNYINNASQTSQYYNFAGWANAADIIWESTLQRAATLNGNGQGINFMQRLENRSSYTVTIGSTMNLSGGKNGSTVIELNPVNADMVVNGNIYNDTGNAGAGVNYKTYGANSKLLTINSRLGGSSSVSYAIEAYSKVLFTAAQSIGGTGTFDVKQGELWIGTGGSLTNGMRINLGLSDANTAKFYLTGTANDSHAITVANNGGVKVVGTLGSGGATNTFSGNITNNATSGGVLLENTTNGVANFTGVISGTGSVQIGGGATGSTAATVILNGANTFSGPLYVSAGTLSITNANSLGSGQIQLGNAGISTVLLVNSNTTITNQFRINNAATNAAINVASGVTLTISGQTTQDSTKINTTKYGKDGAGILILSGTNSDYNGQLQIGQGTVIVGVNNALGTNVTTSARGVDLGLNVGDTAQSNNVSLLISNGVTFGQSIYVATNLSSATRTIGLSGAGASGSFTNEIYQDGDLTLDAGSSTGTLTVSGSIITNTAAVAKNIIITNGSVTLSGTNSYAGTTTIGAGATLNLTGVNSGSGSVVVGTSAGVSTLKINRTNGLTNANLAGASSLANAGLVDLTAGGNYSIRSLGSSANSGGNINFTNSSGQDTTVTFTAGTNFFRTGSNGGRDITNQSANLTLIFNGVVDIGSSTVGTQLLTGAGNFTFLGAITNSGTAVQSLQKSGAGTMVLAGSNSYNGSTTISGGSLVISNNGTLGVSTSSITISGGSTINLGGLTRTNGSLTISSGGFLTNGTLSVANSITLTNNNTQTLAVSANLAGAASMTKVNSGTALLTGANTYTGGTLIANGALQGNTTSLQGNITNNASLVFNQTSSGSYTGVISGTGDTTITGSGAVVTMGANNTYVGSTIVGNGATLVSTSFGFNTNTNTALTTALGIGTNVFKKLSLSIDGGTLKYTGAGETNYVYFYVGTNGATFDASGTGAQLWNGGSGAFVVSGDTNALRTITLTGTNTGTNVIAAKITNASSSGLTKVVKTGSGTWSLGSSVSDYSGGTELRQGTLVIAGSSDNFGTGEFQMYDGTTLTSSSTSVRTNKNNNNFKLGGNLSMSWLEFSNTTLTNNTTISVLGTNSTKNSSITFAGSGIAETGVSRSLTLNAGQGATETNTWITFSGANSFSGGLTLGSGMSVRLTGNGTLGATNGAVNLGNGVIDLGGRTVTNGALTVSTGTISNGTISASSIAFTNAGSISAALAGSGALTKTGAGTSVLSGTNTYSGGTTISAGSLQGDTSSLQGDITNNANLFFNQSSNGVYAGILSGSGALSIDGNSTAVITLSGNNNFTGLTSFTNATLRLGSVTALGTGGSDWTISGTRLGSGAILDLNGLNIANEALGMNASTAYVTNSSTTTAIWGGAINMTNGTNQFNVASGKDITVSGSISGTASRQLMKNGDGVLTVAGSANTNGGAININGGTYRMGHNTALGSNFTSNDVTVASGATLDLNGYTATASIKPIKLSGAGVGDGGALQNSASNTTATLNNAVVLNANSSVGGAGNITMANSVSGASILTKVGAGTLAFGSGASASVSTIAIQQGTLLLGAANQISDSSAVTLAGGTLNTGGVADRAGILTVSQNSAISGMVASSGAGVASSNDFLFSSVDLSNYSTSGGVTSGATLNLGNYSYGQSINIASSNYTSWGSYSESSLNAFADKIQFGNTGMKAQISFNGGSGANALTYVTAIPEPKVYVAMAMLVALVGLTEYKRRKKAVKV